MEHYSIPLITFKIKMFQFVTYREKEKISLKDTGYLENIMKDHYHKYGCEFKF